MKVEAKDIKKGDKIKISGIICQVISTELSDIGKQGKRKCRIETKTEKGETIVLIRPEDYPIEAL